MPRVSRTQLKRALREYMRELAIKGGKKGGKARAKKLTPEERSESARRAVRARWAKPRAKKVR
jgi:hypothetical protein